MINTVRITFLIFLVLISIFGTLFLLGLQDLTLKVQTATPATQYSASVAWLEVCGVYLPEPLVDINWL